MMARARMVLPMGNYAKCNLAKGIVISGHCNGNTTCIS